MRLSRGAILPPTGIATASGEAFVREEVGVAIPKLGSWRSHRGYFRSEPCAGAISMASSGAQEPMRPS
eukprot:4248941-Alexandrium_andersonii.AAC.1